MIIQMKKNSTKEQYNEIASFLINRNFKIKDVSSDEVTIFGVIGDTSTLDLNGLYAFHGIQNITRVLVPFKKASRMMKEEDTVIELPNGIKIGGGHFAVMAGPCSVESEEQLRSIAKAVKESGANILRGGAYKPRTSPYSFQGLELEGLKLLRKVADEFDLLVVSEIMDSNLIPTFEKYVDILQVGARNMQNFQLLKALGKANKPVLLKRGMSATIEEWLMSAEYILVGGNKNVILCERGIRTFEKYTRNTLDISSVLAVRELSHLPVIIDPSHAAGKWEMIEKLSLAGLAVGSDGLIIEVHHDPIHALSDGAQSLKPHKFDRVMKKIISLADSFDKKL